jgi:hypothetical protein
MERGNEESEQWRIEIVPAPGARDSVGVAAIEERSARLGVDGKISSMCVDVVRIKVGTSSHISESPDEQDGNNDNPDPATPSSPDVHYSFPDSYTLWSVSALCCNRNLQGRTRASPTTRPLIFETPWVRSTKVMGTS